MSFIVNLEAVCIRIKIVSSTCLTPRKYQGFILAFYALFQHGGGLKLLLLC